MCFGSPSVFEYEHRLASKPEPETWIGDRAGELRQVGGVGGDALVSDARDGDRRLKPLSRLQRVGQPNVTPAERSRFRPTITLERGFHPWRIGPRRGSGRPIGMLVRVILENVCQLLELLRGRSSVGQPLGSSPRGDEKGRSQRRDKKRDRHDKHRERALFPVRVRGNVRLCCG